MKDYNFVDDTIIGAVRSLVCFYGYYTYIKRNYFRLRSNSWFFDRREVKQYCSDVSGYSQFLQIIRKYGVDDFLNCCKYVHNIYMRTTRAKKRISYMLDTFKTVYFVTLTLSDESLSLPFDFVLKVVKKTFSSSSSCYLFNADFSPDLHRLHFHGVCTLDLIDDPQKLSYNLGFYKVQRVGSSFSERSESFSDDTRISNYIIKLAKHSTKDSAALKIYYSRLNCGS